LANELLVGGLQQRCGFRYDLALRGRGQRDAQALLVRALGLEILIEKPYLMFVVASCCESFSRSRLTVTRTKFFYQPDQLPVSLTDFGKSRTNVAGIRWHIGIPSGIVVGMVRAAGAESDGSKGKHAEKGNWCRGDLLRLF
jgi:hypothetical protein